MEDKHDTVNNSVFYEFSSEARKYFFDPNQKSNLSLLYKIDLSSGLVGWKFLRFWNQVYSNLNLK